LLTSRAMLSFLERVVKGEGEPDPPDTLRDVLDAERREIETSRQVRYHRADQPANVHETYVGVALSGGGIRSATVSLGLLQGMHDLGVLRTVDYLSTVSGGGFTGGWWTAWLSRAHPIDTAAATPTELYHFPPPEQREPERAPDFTKNEDPPDGSRFAGHDPIHHLRLFANYLTPRKGLLSNDTWRAAAVFSRNLLLTWLVLVPILCAVVLLGQLYYIAQPFNDQVVRSFVHADEPRNYSHDEDLHSLDGDILWPRAKVAARPLLALLLLMGVVTALWMHFNNAGAWYTHAAVIAALAIMAVAGVFAWDPGLSDTDPVPSGPLGDRVWDIGVAALTIMMAAYILWDIHRRGGEATAVSKQTKAGRATRWHTRLLTAFAVIGLTLAFAGFAHEFLIEVAFNIKDWTLPTWKEKLAVLTAAAGAVSTIYTVFVSAPTAGKDRREVGRLSRPSRMVLAVAPPLALVLLAAAAALAMHWVLFEVLVFPKRTNWLRVGAWTSLTLAIVLAWWENRRIAVEGVQVPRIYMAFTTLLLIALAPGMPTARWTQQWGFTPGSLLVLGVAVALFVALGLVRLPRRSARVRSLLAFVIVFLVVWMAVLWLAGVNDPRTEPLRVAVCIVGGFAGWILALGWVADPNALSLHTFYKARLVRAYLGASNAARNRDEHDIAEPDGHDDVRLKDIRSSQYGGPYHLINTTLNLIGGRDLVTAQRWSANYVLAPRYCGSTRTGFRRTDKYMGGDLTLGAAVAASGAAVSPNMGAATPSSALALLLGAFNIRLGLWVPTPRRPSWMLPQMWLWPYYLLRESLSQTNDLGSHCYLTDGGHFDNTGLYSLVERGCRYIILADNGADPEPCFADLGEAIRRCRIDFRADIRLDTRAFHPADDKPGTTHVVYGEIYYDAGHLRSLGWTNVTGAAAVGRLVWIKPAVLPGDTADVRQYRLENDSFPQQSTADQWFGESQFESYRKLGELSARAAFGGPPLLTGPLTTTMVDAFFNSLERPKAGDEGAAWKAGDDSRRWLRQFAGWLQSLALPPQPM
jgi:hypothetical protein